MIKEKSHNYVYEIKYSNNKKYIGVRSCNCEPKDDTSYLGSSKIIPNDVKSTGIKTILKTFNNREDAVKYEMELQLKYNVKFSDEYYNQVIQTSTKFDQSGCKAETHAHVKSMQDKLIGRTKEDYEYIRKANKKRALLKGNNQTEAQKLGRLKQADAIRGIKNPSKGHPGATSTSFVPWYFIDNNGIKTIITNISKKDFASSLGLSYRQFIHRFHKDNEHKKLETLKSKNSKIYGWTFGNMTEPSQTKKHKLIGKLY